MKQLMSIFLFICGIFHSAPAQITITNSVFPLIGDTLHYAFGNQPGAINQVFTPPGGSQQWELTNLVAAQYWNQIMKNPQLGLASGSFPEASVLYNPLNSASEVYWQVTGDQVKNLGYFGQDPLKEELGEDVQTLFSDIRLIDSVATPMARERGTRVYLCREPTQDLRAFWRNRMRAIRNW